MVGCGTAWVFTFAKDALLCRAAHGQIDSHQLPKVVMPSAVYVGVVHVNLHVDCPIIVSCAQLDGSVSWSNITKKNDDFWILVGAPVSKNINNTKTV